ncbi:MAG: type IV toxin-antitoxin system AbiEi family antitoxin domain-containing protein [Actinobacteria bacterium]|nr:type IV toxin-antitoxin system AbiEi family antitoxin domain-containing protein [Actinomycetota bacterium]
MPLDRRDLRRQLLALAARQSGYFTAAQAKEIGYSYQAQKYHVDAGNWRRIARGLFRLPEWPVGDHDDLVRWSLWSKERAVVSHETALAVHDLGDVNPRAIHLTVPDSFGQEPPSHIVLHRNELDTDDVEGFEGFRVTTPLRSLFDVAGSETPQETVDKAVADALRAGVVSRRQLLRRADEFGPAAALEIERALASAAAS